MLARSTILAKRQRLHILNVVVKAVQSSRLGGVAVHRGNRDLQGARVARIAFASEESLRQERTRLEGCVIHRSQACGDRRWRPKLGRSAIELDHSREKYTFPRGSMILLSSVGNAQERWECRIRRGVNVSLVA